MLADEVTRRDSKSASLRSRAASLDAGMRLDTGEQTAAVRYDQQLWNELVSPRFLDGPHGALILGPQYGRALSSRLPGPATCGGA